MPSWNKWLAPKFNDNKAEELEKYFSDLEVLLDLYNVANHKQAMVKYLRTETMNLWKITAAWANNVKTYNEFQDEIYPKATEDWTYTIQDWKTIIGH